MPCYNESPHVEGIIRKWLALLQAEVKSFEFIVVNDGSSDGTGRILDNLRREIPEMRVIHQLHLGHPHAIRRGYESVRGRYTLQVDSNDRYDTADFLRMWEQRENYFLILGYRTHRLETWTRQFFSRAMQRSIRFLFGTELKDANVSFRLFHSHALKAYLPEIPAGHQGVNLQLSLLVFSYHPERFGEIAVPYRLRPHGRSHRTFTKLCSTGGSLFFELARLRLVQAKRGFKPSRATVSAH